MKTAKEEIEEFMNDYVLDLINFLNSKGPVWTVSEAGQQHMSDWAKDLTEDLGKHPRFIELNPNEIQEIANGFISMGMSGLKPLE